MCFPFTEAPRTARKWWQPCSRLERLQHCSCLNSEAGAIIYLANGTVGMIFCLTSIIRWHFTEVYRWGRGVLTVGRRHSALCPLTSLYWERWLWARCSSSSKEELMKTLFPSPRAGCLQGCTLTPTPDASPVQGASLAWDGPGESVLYSEKPMSYTKPPDIQMVLILLEVYYP